MTPILGFVIVFIAMSFWDLVRVNSLLKRTIDAVRTSDPRDYQPEWLIRRLEQQAAERKRQA